MAEAEPEKKSCGACSNELPKDSYSKKQWQQKQQRRCKSCVDSNQEIDNSAAAACAKKQSSSAQTSHSSTATTAKKKRSKNKDKPVPVFAGDQGARYKPTTAAAAGYIRAKLASDICAWCGKSQEENEKKLGCCTVCKNVLYCSRACQKAAWPEHKPLCEQMKQDRKDSKKERKEEKKWAKEGKFSISEASGVGSFGLDSKSAGGVSIMSYNGELRGNEEPGQYFATDEAKEGMQRLLGEKNFKIFCKQMKDQCLQAQGTFSRNEIFTEVEELYPIDQFLLSCGPLENLERAKAALPHVLNQISISGLKPDGSIPDIGDIKVRGYSLNALEWAARRGNYSIAEWLATDSRTKVMLTRSDSAPVAWACYTNKIELAKMLVNRGADSHATTEVMFNYKPASFLAGENGQLLAVKYLVEECGHDIQERDMDGQDMRASLRINNKVWASVAGCVAVDEYAKSKGVDGEIDRRNGKTKTTFLRNTNGNQQALEKQLAAALKKLEIAGGKEEESDDDDDDNDQEEDAKPAGEYLNELLAVADARYELGQYAKSGSIYYSAYYAAMHHNSTCINNPAIFPIAHKMTLAWSKSDDEHLIKLAHGMAQQNCMMPGHPPYIREDLKDVEKIMKKKGMNVQRFM